MRTLGLFLALAIILTVGCSKEQGEQISDPSSGNEWQPPGSCGEQPGAVVAVMHEGVNPDDVEALGPALGLEIGAIEWFSFFAQIRIIGTDTDAIESALRGSSLVSELPHPTEVGGTYQVAFRPLVTRDEVIKFLASVGGLELGGLEELPTGVLFLVPEGQEAEWMQILADIEIVESTRRRASCSQ